MILHSLTMRQVRESKELLLVALGCFRSTLSSHIHHADKIHQMPQTDSGALNPAQITNSNSQTLVVAR